MGRCIPIAAIVVFGIVLIKLLDNEVFMIPILGMVLTGFIIAKIMEYLKLKATVASKKTEAGGDMSDRMAEIERRMTDVQDVMIALSEKIDRMEAKGEKLAQ